MHKYLVISHDTDEQAFYHDFVIASSDEAAQQKVLAIRDYCVGAEAIDLRTLRTHYAALSKWSRPRVEKSWQKIINAHKTNQCDNCSKRWRDDELKIPTHLEQRVDENGPEPSGECPECGALCYERD